MFRPALLAMLSAVMLVAPAAADPFDVDSTFAEGGTWTVPPQPKYWTGYGVLPAPAGDMWLALPAASPGEGPGTELLPIDRNGELRSGSVPGAGLEGYARDGDRMLRFSTEGRGPVLLVEQLVWPDRLRVQRRIPLDAGENATELNGIVVAPEAIYVALLTSPQDPSGSVSGANWRPFVLALDPETLRPLESFGSGGTVVYGEPVSGAVNLDYGMALTAHDLLVLRTGARAKHLLAFRRTSGEPDPEFGSGGVAELPAGDYALGGDIAGGALLAVVRDGERFIRLSRLTPALEPDLSYAERIAVPAAGSVQLYDAALTPTGEGMLVSGLAIDAGDGHAFWIQIGGAGRQVASFVSRPDWGYSTLAVLDDGRYAMSFAEKFGPPSILMLKGDPSAYGPVALSADGLRVRLACLKACRGRLESASTRTRRFRLVARGQVAVRLRLNASGRRRLHRAHALQARVRVLSGGRRLDAATIRLRR